MEKNDFLFSLKQESPYTETTDALSVRGWHVKGTVSLTISPLTSHCKKRMVTAAKLQVFSFIFDPARKYLKLQTIVYEDGKWTCGCSTI